MPDHYLAYDLEEMPLNGWIWGCIFCTELTSNIESIEGYQVYSCGKCQKNKTIQQKKEHINECYDFLIKIKKNYTRRHSVMY